MNTRLANQAINYVAVSSALIKKALDKVNAYETAEKQAADKQPELLEQMLKAGCVAEHQQEAAAEQLNSHAGALGMLKRAVDTIDRLQGQLQKSGSDLGEGVDPQEIGAGQTKQAYDSLNDGYCGRKTAQPKKSDEAIMAVLN